MPSTMPYQLPAGADVTKPYGDPAGGAGPAPGGNVTMPYKVTGSEPNPAGQISPNDSIFHTAAAQPVQQPADTGQWPGVANPNGNGIVQNAQSVQVNAPKQWNVTEDQTVEGRIGRIIGAGSPLQEQAKARSLEAAGARGLANTSMAVTAGESALYDSAMPIAQADAATAARAAGYNVDQSNQFARANADSENQFRLSDKQIAGQGWLADKDIAARGWLADKQALNERDTQGWLMDKQGARERDLALINRDTQVQLAQLGAEHQAQAAALQQQHQKLLETNAQASSSFNQAVAAVNAIQNNPQMDANAKTQAIANVWHDVQTQFKVLGAVAGLGLDQQLDLTNYPGFDANGRWVGFDASGNTAAPAAPGAAPAPAYGPTGAPTGAPAPVWSDGSNPS